MKISECSRMFRLGAYTKVCGEDNNGTQANKQKSNFVLSFMLSKARAVGIKFCYGEISDLKSAV